jgi:cytoskeletal protein CcmA (bactofilin family)
MSDGHTTIIIKSMYIDGSVSVRHTFYIDGSVSVRHTFYIDGSVSVTTINTKSMSD